MINQKAKKSNQISFDILMSNVDNAVKVAKIILFPDLLGITLFLCK